MIFNTFTVLWLIVVTSLSTASFMVGDTLAAVLFTISTLMMALVVWSGMNK